MAEMLLGIASKEANATLAAHPTPVSGIQPNSRILRKTRPAKTSLVRPDVLDGIAFCPTIGNEEA